MLSNSSAPAVEPPAEFRLPGPHYVLENARIQRKMDPEDRDREKQRNMSAADLWFRSKKRSREESPVMMTPPMSRAQDEAAAAAIPLPVNGAPEIPIWLAEARGCDPLPDTPPQDYGTADAQVWGADSSQAGVGLGLSNAYLFDGSWSMSPSQAEYDVMLGNQYGHLGPTTLLYERARGSASTAIPPVMHAGGGGSDRRAYYERAGGAQLPYPQHLNDFVG